MKNLFLSLITVAALCLTGCTTSTPTNPEAAKLQRINSLAYLAASIGCSTTLQQLPDSRPKFELALQNLTVLVEAKQITGAQLKAIIGSLPVDALNGGQAKIYVDAAVVLYDLLVGDKLSLEAAPYVLAAATGIRDGLTVALKQ